jgi:hypothetical protein
MDGIRDHERVRVLGTLHFELSDIALEDLQNTTVVKLLAKGWLSASVTIGTKRDFAWLMHDALQKSVSMHWRCTIVMSSCHSVHNLSCDSLT